MQGPGFKKNYQMHLKSHSGPIHVLLVNKDTEETSPVVVQVPPPKDDDLENQNVDPNQAPGKSKPIKVRCLRILKLNTEWMCLSIKLKFMW